MGNHTHYNMPPQIPEADVKRTEENLGSGSAMWVATWKTRDETRDVALKIGKLQTPEQHENFNREVKIYLKVDHPNIVKFYGYFISSPSVRHGPPHQQSNMLFELCWCDLSQAADLVKFTPSLAQHLSILIGTVRGLNYLHTMKPVPI